LDKLDLEADFDPDQHDAQMVGAFGDSYYEAEDSGIVSPSFLARYTSWFIWQRIFAGG
jgi:KRI1-like family